MHHDATSVMGKSMMSHTIGTATYGGRGQGKFIDNVGYGMSKGPTTPSQARSPRRSPRSKHASGGASTTSYARGNARMEDLQAKNAMMRQDIARMKECMDGGSVSPSRRGPAVPAHLAAHGGRSVAAGDAAERRGKERAGRGRQRGERKSEAVRWPQSAVREREEEGAAQPDADKKRMRDERTATFESE
ncbi:hypothetical protein ACHAXT_007814 [Thalassiosira profunda]